MMIFYANFQKKAQEGENNVMAENQSQQDPRQEQEQQHEQEQHTWMEEIEIAGNQLVDTVKNLLQEGNVRRIIIRDPNDRVLLEIPLGAGVAVGSVMTVFAPILVAVGAMAALVSLVKVEVVRVDNQEEDGNESG
jgi:1,4-alpha-glucan branching enzyme